jgi:uncharacterized Zn finger protein (UPF0148 family)
MIERIKHCPVCGYKLLARHNDEVFCLSPSCSWKTISKRKEDIQIPLLNKLREDWE